MKTNHVTPQGKKHKIGLPIHSQIRAGLFVGRRQDPLPETQPKQQIKR